MVTQRRKDRFIEDIALDISKDREPVDELRRQGEPSFWDKWGERMPSFLDRWSPFRRRGMPELDYPASARVTTEQPPRFEMPTPTQIAKAMQAKGLPLSDEQLRLIEEEQYWGEQKAPPEWMRRPATQVSGKAMAAPMMGVPPFRVGQEPTGGMAPEYLPVSQAITPERGSIPPVTTGRYLTSGEIAMAALVLYGGYKGGSIIRSATEFRRLPEYDALVKFAESEGIPVNSARFKNAETAMRSAVNLYRGGAKEAANEIMAQFYKSQAKTMPSTQIPRVSPTVAPKGTQTGAMAFGGLPKPIKGKPIIKPEVPVTPEVAAQIQKYEKLRGLTGRALTSTPDEPTLLAQRGEAEAFLATQGKGRIEIARQEVEAARRSWEENFGGKRLNPRMEAAIIQAEKVLAESEALATPEVAPEPIPEAPQAIPVTEAGQPEAGLQETMLPGEVAAREVTPALPAEKPMPIAEPPAIPPVEPPRPPELELPPEPIIKPRGISFAPLQDTQTVIDIATKPDASRWLANLPFIREITKHVNPSALADTPSWKSIIAREVLRDESMQKTQGIMAYLNQLGEQSKVFGRLDHKGLIASGPLKGLSVNDIRTYPEKYKGKLTDEQKNWIAKAQEIEEAKLAYLRSNDIEIDELAFEEGGVYAGRRVYAKVSANGEILETAYVGAGPSRVGAKLAAQKHRTFKTADEAINAGYRYIPDDEALGFNVRAAYYRVADKQMSEWLLTQVPWRTTGAPDELILAAEGARRSLLKSKQLLAALNRANRGEKLPVQTVSSIAGAYPDEAQQLQAIIDAKQAGKSVTSKVKVLRSKAKALIDVSSKEWRDASNARARARERAQAIKIDEAMVMHPAFQGKVFTGSEAKETARTLMQNLTPQYSGILGSMNKVNALVRYSKLAGDMSPMLIQLLFLAGENPRIYGDAFITAIEALVSPKNHEAYLFKNKSVIDKHPNLMISSSGTEFTEALTRGGLLAPHIQLVPEYESFFKSLGLFVPRLVGKAGRTVLEPFQRFFEAILDGAGIEMAKSMEHLAKTPAEIADLDQFINEFRGLTSSARLGVSPNWRAAETATLLAPRYNRSIAALLFDASKGMGRGGLRAKLARNALIKGIGFVALVWLALGIVLGKKPDELEETLNSTSSKFMTYNIYGTNIGPGSKVRSVIKLIAESAENPEDLWQLSMDNPSLRFVRGNLAPVPSNAIDIITGRNYIGDPVRDSLGQFSEEMIAKNFMPIWVENVVFEGGTVGERLLRGSGEFFGGRAYPETTWEEVSRLRERYAARQYGTTYDDLNNSQRGKLKAQYHDLVQAEEKAKKDMAVKGTPIERFYYLEKERITEERNNALDKAAQAYLNQQISKYDYDKERSRIRPYYSGGMEVLWSVKENFDEYSVKQMEKWLDENLKPEDKALGEYNEYRAGLIEGAELPRDWDAIELWMAEYIKKYEPDIQKYIIENQNAWIQEYPRFAKHVETLRAQGIEDESWWIGYRDIPSKEPNLLERWGRKR
jgi:hypothetical protein